MRRVGAAHGLVDEVRADVVPVWLHRFPGIALPGGAGDAGGLAGVDILADYLSHGPFRTVAEPPALPGLRFRPDAIGRVEDVTPALAGDGIGIDDSPAAAESLDREIGAVWHSILSTSATEMRFSAPSGNAVSSPRRIMFRIMPSEQAQRSASVATV